MHENKMTVHNSVAEPWRVTLVDTGDATGTGVCGAASRNISTATTPSA